MGEKFQTVKQAASLKEYASSKLETKGKYYVCPVCKSGTGKNGTPAFSIKGESWKCFSCGNGGDVFDLAGIIEGTSEKKEQLEAVASWAGIPLEADYSADRVQPNKPSADNEALKKGRAAHAQYIRECQARISDPRAVEYLETRGISQEQAIEWGLGFDPNPRNGAKDEAGEWINPKPARIVIPYPNSDYYHVDRAISPNAKSGKYSKPNSSEVGAEPLWGEDCLTGDGVVFVCEGQFDAMFVAKEGHKAVCVGGAANWEKALSKARANGFKGILCFAFDFDEAGIEASSRAKETAESFGIAATEFDWKSLIEEQEVPFSVEVKPGFDLSDLWEQGVLLETLDSEVDNAIDEFVRLKKQEKEAELSSYRQSMQNLRAFDPLTIAAGLMDEENQSDPIPTGFKKFDGKLGGGLMPGVYVIGAVSSLGKTTWCVQVADQIAASGQPVLFVTIEMRAREIAAKSISRYAWMKNNQRGSKNPSGYALTAQEIQNRLVRKSWDEEQRAMFEIATSDYLNSTGENLRIMEGVGRPSVKDIESVARYMKELNGVSPVVFIDYLQLLGVEEGHERDTDKQSADFNIMALRQLAGDLKTPVFIISSFNRDSYNSAVSMSSFKESGGIEYGADVVLGLQPCGAAGMKKSDFEEAVDDSKNTRVREIELTILKNRNGMTTGKKGGIEFWYDSWTNYYKEK